MRITMPGPIYGANTTEKIIAGVGVITLAACGIGAAILADKAEDATKKYIHRKASFFSR